MKLFCLAAIFTLTSFFGKGQSLLSNHGERLIAVMPVIGKGTVSDPLRPLFLPARSLPPVASAEAAARVPNLRAVRDVESWSWHLSDDKKFAIVECVARERGAFQQILADPRIRAFVKGKDRKDDIERESVYLKRIFGSASSSAQGAVDERRTVPYGLHSPLRVGCG